MKPTSKPVNPNFSSGPCSKRPGYNVNDLDISTLGRSHRSSPGKAALLQACQETAQVLGLPEGYRVGVVPASDTGAVEMALWSMLGARPVDVFSWESFGQGWLSDITKQLKLDNVSDYHADYGSLPDLQQANPEHDIVFTWNGTTSGVKVPNGDWVASDRQGLTLVDATSAVFAQDIAWDKVDVLTYSWQKVMGGEGQHGMLVLSPRAVARLESYTPAWPMPKIFRLTKGGKVIKGIFEGATINTPSMLALEDYVDGLQWAEQIGGLSAMKARADANAKVLNDWMERTNWVANLAVRPEIASNTSVCLKIVDADIVALEPEAQAAFAKRIVKLLDEEGVALDIGSYRDAPAGLRIWAGATVEAGDLQALTPWLDWAFAAAKAEIA